MKRIAINGLSARGGGGSTYLKNFLRYIPEKLENRIFLFMLSSNKIEFLKNKKNLTIIYINDRGPIFRVFWENTVFLVLLKKYKIDIVFSPGGMLPMFLSKKIIFVTMFRNMIPFDTKELKKYRFSLNYIRNKLLSIFLLCSMKRADKLIFISKFGKNFVNKITNYSIKKSIVIPHGVSEEFLFEKPSLDYIKLTSCNYILYPSTVDFYKNQIQVVQAYDMLTKVMKRAPKLIFTGKLHQPYATDLKIFIKRKNLTNNIILTGAVDFKEMPNLYQKAKLIIFASRSENCPNILMEAMVAGKAIVCSKKYPMPEFGKDGVLYCDSNNPKDIFEKISYLINDKQAVNTLEIKAKKNSSKYSAKISAEKAWSSLLN